jgi:hypothetical protein
MEKGLDISGPFSLWSVDRVTVKVPMRGWPFQHPMYLLRIGGVRDRQNAAR